jgi:DNA gyrase subunit A
MRGRTHIEDFRDREAIVITEVPYQQNKSRLVARIGEVVKEKLIDGITQVRDESNREGVRVVIELKRDAMSDVVLNQLYQFTPLQTSFGVNALALNRGRPELMNLKQIVAAFIDFREEVITRRSAFLLRKTREQSHSSMGLAVAVANLDAIIELIRRAPDPQTAKEQLLARTWPAESVIELIKLIDDPANLEEVARAYQLSEAQAKAILDLRLQRLTGLERDKIAGELREMAAKITYNLEILDSRPKRLDLLRAELIEMKEKFGQPRVTEIQDLEFEADIEALIQREDMVVTVTHGGYIKRVPLSTYRAQRRGGRGRTGMATREEDFVSQVFVADTLTPMLFFSTRGMVYKMKVYRLPLGNPQARGKALINLLPLEEGETISTVMPLPEDESTWAQSQIVFATASGYVRRNELSDFVDVKANGKIAMKLEDGDRLIGVGVCTEASDLLLAARSGKAIRFAVGDVRVFAGRDSIGVRGIRLEEGDRVVSMSVLGHVEFELEERDAYLRHAVAKRRALGEDAEVDEGESAAIVLPQERLNELEIREEFILTVTSKGFGKRTSAYEYRVIGRGGQGVANIEVTPRNGPVVASFPVGEDDQIMLVTNRGQLIRCPVHDIRIARRQTQGVTVFRVADEEEVVAVAHLSDLGEDEGGNDEAPEGDAPAGGGK